MGDAIGERIKIAFDIFTMLQLPREPVLGNISGPACKELEYAAHEMGVFGGRNVAVVGHLAGRPEELHFNF